MSKSDRLVEIENILVTAQKELTLLKAKAASTKSIKLEQKYKEHQLVVRELIGLVKEAKAKDAALNEALLKAKARNDWEEICKEHGIVNPEASYNTFKRSV